MKRKKYCVITFSKHVIWSQRSDVQNRRAVFVQFAGTAVATFKSDDGSCWAALVVTPIMARTQSLEASRELIFLDSTSSCDDGQSTTTVLLAATKAGAVPIAVIVHSSQSTEGYTAAFSLLQRHYPLCFGGVHVSLLCNHGNPGELETLEHLWSTCKIFKSPI